MAKVTEVTFTQDKETKTKIRFTCDEGPIVGNLYVDKDKAKDFASDDKVVIKVES